MNMVHTVECQSILLLIKDSVASATNARITPILH